jgi:hypothetical protein
MKFDQFYLYYLTQHQNKTCRTFHFVGTSLVFSTLISAIMYGRPEFLVLAPVFGYGLSWIGHFGFEKNKPAAFRYPIFSLFADFKMFGDILTGKINVKLEEAKKASF